MTDDVGYAAALGASINSGLGKIPVPKPKKPKETTTEEPAEGKTPSATDVRTALRGGKITPLEATDLNPDGGMKPSAADVRDAFQSGKISFEEATNLHPTAKLRSRQFDGY
jgi:hypothetical protein